MKSTILKTTNGMYITRRLGLTTDRKLALEFDSANRAKNMKDIIENEIPFEILLAPATDK